jgi:hypothetical protein
MTERAHRAEVSSSSWQAAGAQARPVAAGRRKRRMPKGAVRTFAWIGGAASFLSPFVVLGVAPKPAPAATGPTQSAPRRVLVVHHVIRKIIITEAPTSSGPQYVSSGSGGTVYVPAPAAPPVASSGGSHP